MSLIVEALLVRMQLTWLNERLNRQYVRIGIVPPLEIVTCSHVFSPQLPLNQTCKLSSPNRLCALRRFRASKTLQSVGFRGPLRQWGVFDCKDASDQIAGTVLPPPPPPPPPPKTRSPARTSRINTSANRRPPSTRCGYHHEMTDIA